MSLSVDWFGFAVLAVWAPSALCALRWFRHLTKPAAAALQLSHLLDVPHPGAHLVIGKALAHNSVFTGDIRLDRTPRSITVM